MNAKERNSILGGVWLLAAILVLGGVWLLAAILAGACIGILSVYLDCPYLKYVAYAFAGASGGIIGDKYFSGRKMKRKPWWKWALGIVGLLAFAGLLAWIFE